MAETLGYYPLILKGEGENHFVVGDDLWKTRNNRPKRKSKAKAMIKKLVDYPPFLRRS